jgi:hypothetical protein
MRRAPRHPPIILVLGMLLAAQGGFLAALLLQPRRAEPEAPAVFVITLPEARPLPVAAPALPQRAATAFIRNSRGTAAPSEGEPALSAPARSTDPLQVAWRSVIDGLVQSPPIAQGPARPLPPATPQAREARGALWAGVLDAASTPGPPGADAPPATAWPGARLQGWAGGGQAGVLRLTGRPASTEIDSGTDWAERPGALRDGGILQDGGQAIERLRARFDTEEEPWARFEEEDGLDPRERRALILLGLLAARRLTDPGADAEVLP